MEIVFAGVCNFFLGMLVMFFICAAAKGIAETDKEAKSELNQDLSEFEDLVAKSRKDILGKEE